MFYKMLFDRFVGFAYLYTVLDMPRQIRIVCLHKGAVLCFVNNGKTQHRARATFQRTVDLVAHAEALACNTLRKFNVLYCNIGASRSSKRTGTD